ncbi:hypothetical protein J2847_005363 [Azospirillum agricola]|uniref:hypothetical protein n=1 Tax=Azospirillum agricola TaxID=1720247 RepID=UPI001AEB8335|nr:hypothetical protein [Azospirillum agricola]MBP2232038.1 hypothetical protein [Azospirillum agricola]
MTGMMLYIALGLMVLTVLSNRYWRRQLVLTRIAMSKLKDKVDDAGKELTDAAADHAHLAQQHADMEKRVQKAEVDLQAALQELDQKKVAPLDRYFIFDRLEPRPGRFWEVAVRHSAAGMHLGDMRGFRGWSGIRRYILIADSERDARDRASSRFPRKVGFEVVEVAGCRVNGLSVSRIAELSTFRKPGKDEEDGAAKAPRKASVARS